MVLGNRPSVNLGAAGEPLRSYCGTVGNHPWTHRRWGPPPRRAGALGGAPTGCDQWGLIAGLRRWGNRFYLFESPVWAGVFRASRHARGPALCLRVPIGRACSDLRNPVLFRRKVLRASHEAAAPRHAILVRLERDPRTPGASAALPASTACPGRRTASLDTWPDASPSGRAVSRSLYEERVAIWA